MIAAVLVALLSVHSAEVDEELRFIRETVAGKRGLPGLAEIQLRAVAVLLPGIETTSDGWSKRARLRGLLPRVDARVGRDTLLNLRGAVEDFAPWTRTEGQTLGFDVRVRFELGALMYSEQELRAHRERLARASVLRGARLEATRSYFKLLEALLAARREPTARRALEVERAAAELRALVGSLEFDRDAMLCQGAPESGGGPEDGS